MSSTIQETKVKIWDTLQQVKDPEIPVISVVDLGIISRVEFIDEQLKVSITPTFVGCPALDYMKTDIGKKLREAGFENVEVSVDHETKWSSNLITEKGKQQLRDFGMAPPPKKIGDVQLSDLEKSPCPKCGSTNTALNSPFGPTLCRAIHKCYDCGEAFEQFKPV